MPATNPVLYRRTNSAVDKDPDKIKVQHLEQLRFAIYDVQSATAGSSHGGDTTLTRDQPSVKELCRSVDRLIRLHLKSGADEYWNVIREHLSKEDLKILIAKWKPKSNRGSCLSWIYQSFNDGLLSWHMLSFCNAQHRLSKFYNHGAFMLDKDALALASEMLVAVDGLNFDLVPPKPEDRSERVKIDKKVVPIAQRRPRGAQVPVAKLSQVAQVETNVADMSECPWLNPRMMDSLNKSAVVNDAELCTEAEFFEFASGTPLIDGVLPQNYVKEKVASRKKSRARMATRSDQILSMDSPSQRNSEYKLSSTPLDSCVNLPAVQHVIHSDMEREEKRGSPDGVEHPAPPFTEEVKCDESMNQDNLVINPTPKNNVSSVASQVDVVEIERSFDPSLQLFCEPKTKHEQCTLTLPAVSAVKMRHKHLRQDLEESYEEQIRRHMENRSVSTRLSELSEDSFNRERRFDEDSDAFDGRVSLDATVDFSCGEETSPNYCNAEIFLESGEVIDLAVKVFLKEGETFYKMYRVYENFHLGCPVIRWLMITSYAVYLMKKEEDDLEETGDAPKKVAEMNGSLHNDHHDSGFLAVKTAPFRVIDGIFIGLNQQMFTIILKNQATNFIVCTGSECVTRSIMSSMEVAERRFGGGAMELPYVASDCTPQRVALATWSASEFNASHKKRISLRFYALCFWTRHESVGSGSPAKGVAGRSGYLNKRYYDKSAWFKKSTPWKQHYFILKGHKLYEFDDSTCKRGIQIINLHDDVISCNEAYMTVQNDEHRHCMDLLLRNGTQECSMQLQCHDRHDLIQWIINITCVLSMPDPSVESSFDMSAGFVLLTESGVLVGQDTGDNHTFIRTLGCVKFHEIGKVVLFTKKDIFIAQLYISGGCDAGMIWSVCLASQQELDNFQKSLQDLVNIPVEYEELDEESSYLTPFVCKETGELINFWNKCF